MAKPRGRPPKGMGKRPATSETAQLARRAAGIRSAAREVESHRGKQVEAPDGPTNVFDEYEADDYVVVYRVNPQTKQPTYLYRLEPNEAREDVLQMYTGGGKYILKLARYMPEKAGVNYVQSRTVYVDGDPLPLTKLPPATEKAAALVRGRVDSMASMTAPKEAPAGGVTVDQILTGGLIQLLQGTREVQEMQLRTFQTSQREPIPWDKVLAAAVPLVIKLLDSRAQPDTMEQMKELAKLLRTETNADPMKMVRDQLELMDSYMGLKERIAPVEDAASGPLHIMERILGVIEGQQKKLGRPPSADEVRAALPGAIAPGETVPGSPMWTHVLQRWGAQLVAAAMRNADPDVTADYVAQMLPDAVIGSVVELLQLEDNGACVLAAVPRLAEFPQWTTRFLTRLWANVGPDEEQEEEQEGGDDAER